MKKITVITSAFTAAALLMFAAACFILTGFVTDTGNDPSMSGNWKARSKNLYIPEARYVDATSGLALMDTPSESGKAIVTIPYREEVYVVETGNGNEEISGIKGSWTKISWLRYKGWVFGGFLSEKIPEFIIPGGAKAVKSLEIKGRSFGASSSLDEIEIRSTFSLDISFYDNGTVVKSFSDNSPEVDKNGNYISVYSFKNLTGQYSINNGVVTVNFNTQESATGDEKPKKEDINITVKYLCAQTDKMDMLIGSDGEFFLSYRKK